MDSINQILSQASCLRFSIGEIKRATNEFAKENLLRADDGFGVVYHGEISEHGYTGKVFVKRMNFWARGADLEFKKQISTPRHHANIISLVGFCLIEWEKKEREEMILVYEFIPNGSLNDYLYTKQDLMIPRLTVEQRLHICVGVAKGLSYLHSQNDNNINTHGDIRTENVLLDESLVPKISNLSKTQTLEHIFPDSTYFDINILGKQLILAPECYEWGSKPSQQSDVYAFGVLLLEVLCERPSWKGLLVLALPLLIKGELPKLTPEYV